ncbi:MAG: glycoside hydrolase family 65 [Tepidisphaeraceae bacterium]
MPISRRTLLAAGAWAAGGLLGGRWLVRAAGGAETGGGSSIDRRALVRRHHPRVERFDPFSALSVGNGNFAFTADATGLQTFVEEYREQFPLCTCAHWAWHTTPAPHGVRPEDFRYRQYDSHGRGVGYATQREGQEILFDWLRQNPHRMHLGRVGFILKRADGSEAKPSDVALAGQTLDLWTGVIASNFQFEGRQVAVQTACHPELNSLAVRIVSPLVGAGKLGVRLAFPYASPEMDMADWNSPHKHETRCEKSEGGAEFRRTLDGDRYWARVKWTSGSLKQVGPHEFSILASRGDRLDIVVHFSPQPGAFALPSAEQILRASADHWERFWTQGAAMDLSGSGDARAAELERRIVLSQYNTALHCAGVMPPPETGLLFNSWYGKSHLEMHWWHGVHFAAWNRFELFERSLDFYQRILPVARQIAQRQGYDGIRWPKMVGPRGHDSPSPVGPLLIWQQPHPIYYAELCYRRTPTKETLEKWRGIVFETANFLASFAAREGDRLVLGPPMKAVPENTDAMATKNPTFELAYWRFGLSVAQTWRERLGMGPEAKWGDALKRLSPLPQEDGRYLLMEGMSDTYTRWNWEHPSLLGAYGMQRGDEVDPETMRRSLRKVLDVWQWDRCWGWDFPMAAMTAAKLGEGELAIRALMIDSPKNRYLPNGHVYQQPGLSAYLPANGGLLAAVAMMARAGAFGRDGKWAVRAEGLGRLL